MTPGFDPTQVDWNNPGVEYLMKNFERIMADHRDEIMSLTKSNNQMKSEKEQMASRNKELEERCSHLEAKYDKLIEMYNKLLDGAGNGITPDNPPTDSDAGSKTTPKRHPEDGRRSSYNVREFTGYPRPKPPARSEAGLPTRGHVVHETMTADEIACRKCDYVLSAPTAEYKKNHGGSGGSQMAGDVLDDHPAVLQKVPQTAGCQDLRRAAKRALRNKHHGPGSDAAVHGRFV